MRVNPTNSSVAFLPPSKTDVNPKRYVRGGAVLLPKSEGMALPLTFSHLKSKDPYSTGMGETLSSNRAGADQHLVIKSRGF